MITVIIAGGSGTRLWPLSTPSHPKHLLKLVSKDSLLQQAYERAKKLSKEIYVVTEASHSEHVKRQLKELKDDHFLIEPGRRGTAHCIIFALDYIARHHSHDESIAFIHSDHNVRDMDGFAHSFLTASDISSKNKMITLIGIEPTFPATGFGYICRDGIIDKSRGVHKVERFKEKPNHSTALKYVESGKYLWNCGYFVGSVNIFLKTMKENAPSLFNNYQKLSNIEQYSSEDYNKAYLSFGNKVIDIALIEKTKNLAVVSASFDWADVGSFKDLHEVVPKNESRNYEHGENIHTIETENTYIRNEEEKPIAVIGLDNVVVINTPEGILVSRKDISARVGEIAKKI